MIRKSAGFASPKATCVSRPVANPRRDPGSADGLSCRRRRQRVRVPDRVQQSSLVPEQPVDRRAWIDNAEATARVLAASAPLYRISAAAAFRIRVRTSPVALGAWYNNGRQDAVERVDDDIRRTRND